MVWDRALEDAVRDDDGPERLAIRTHLGR